MTEQKSNNVVRGWLAALGARSVLSFVFFFAFFMGIWIAGAGLHDPDTCWLLAVGKHIFETGSVPHSDPFSYSFGALKTDGTVDFSALLGGVKTASPREFVPYQWLTELVFYLAYKIGAGYALLVVVDCVLVTALLIGPLMLFRSLRAPMLPAVGLVILSVVAASFHFLARPEIFSYLFFLLMLGLFIRFRLKLENNRPFNKGDLSSLISPAVLMIVWANMHTGFMSAFISLFAFCVITTVEVLCRPKVRKSVLALPWILFFTLVAASMINPFGPGLWRYVPELFFSPINKYINELSSIKLSHLLEWTFYPYFILSVVVLVVLAKAVRIWKRNGRFPIGWSYSVVAPIGVIIAGICCMRLIPFVAVFLMAEVAWLLKGHTRSRSVNDSASVSDARSPLEQIAGEPVTAEKRVTEPDTINARVTRTLSYGPWPGAMLALSLFGVFMISTRVVKPNIPQGSDAFPAPYDAMTFLSSNLPDGRVFNDAPFGDMMIWYLISPEKPILAQDPYDAPPVQKKPKVFMDTRFDMYGAPLVSDYYTIRNAKDGWQAVFDKYQFDWVFLKTKAALVKELEKLEDWKEIYRKENAVIFVRAGSQDFREVDAH